MDAQKVVRDTFSDEEIPIEDARTCAVYGCGAVHDKTGPIGFERGEEPCDHWTCDACHAETPAHKWSGIKQCAACADEARP